MIDRRWVAACGAVLVAAGAVAVAQAAERNFMVTGFNEIEVAGPFDVTVNVGRGQSVRAQGAERDLERLRIQVVGNELRIGSRERGWTDWSKSEPVRIQVTVPSLRAVSLAGSGDVRVDRVKADSFKASLSGSGDLSVGMLAAGDVKLSLAGSGDITAAGSCSSADVSIAGSGDVRIPSLKCQTLSGSIAGSGGIDANVSRTAKLSIMGSGDVTVAGGAKCDVSKMGSGSVRCG